MEGSEPKVIANAEGARTTPSVVAFTETEEVLVGELARRQAVSNSRNTLYATKRYIGRRFDEPEVKNDMNLVSYKIVPSDNNDCWFECRGKKYSPSQIAAFVLGKMKNTAESYLSSKVKNAVITVPAYFNDSQRQATKDAGTIAGLDVRRIINEPTAAALAFGLNKKDQNKTIAVYDLGGGTFDISILEMSDGVFEVKSTNGDTHLGGEDFDNALISYLVEDFKKQYRIDIRNNEKALQRIKEAAEKAKIDLSFTTKTEINLPYLVESNNYQTTISRVKFEQLVNDLVNRTISPCEKALRDAGISTENISEVLLVGGMTRMPKIQELVKSIFKKEPSKSVNPDEAVAVGAAIQGGVLVGHVSDILLLDVTPLKLGINTKGGKMATIIENNTTIPVSKKQIFTTSEDYQTQVLIEVFQGDRIMTSDNHKLAEFRLDGIPPLRKGEAKIEVSFDLDSNGILHVSASELSRNVKASTTINHSSGGLSDADIERMKREAEEFRAKDEEAAKLSDLVNHADNLIFSVEEEIGQKDSETIFSTSEIQEAKEQISAVKSQIDRKDHDSLREATNRLADKLSSLLKRRREHEDKKKKDASSDKSENKESSEKTDSTGGSSSSNN